ncbi:Uncharacterised protein [Mycobacteroides abscessus subsp. massiliense]|nr:Uncharacterised protein [Mycobacteroides abscessus subsp. massiliense]
MRPTTVVGPHSPVAATCPGRSVPRYSPKEPSGYHHTGHCLMPAVERNQRCKVNIQCRGSRCPVRLGQPMLNRAAIALPGQERRECGDTNITPGAGLPALLQKAPPLGQRRRIPAHRVRRPQVSGQSNLNPGTPQLQIYRQSNRKCVATGLFLAGRWRSTSSCWHERGHAYRCAR